MKQDDLRNVARNAKFAAILGLIVVGLNACTAKANPSDAFDFPFGVSTASAYYQALYDGSLTPVEGTMRAVDLVAGDPVVDYETYSLFNAKSGPAGLFLGDNLRSGAKSKILRWWDYYGEEPVDFADSLQLAVGIVDFENARSARAAARIEARKTNTTITELDTDKGYEIWAEVKNEGSRILFFTLPPNTSIVIFIACDRYGKMDTSDRCTKESMRRLRDEVSARVPTSSSEPHTVDVAGPNFREGGWEPIVTYEFDSEQITRSYLDPDGDLRSTWTDDPPVGRRYAWSGYSSAYALVSDQPDEPGLQVRVDQVPIGSTASALKVVSTICFNPAGERSPDCGNEEDVSPSRNVLGGRFSATFIEPDSKVVQQVRAHIVTSRYFLDFKCGHPWTFDEKGLSEDEVDSCKTVIGNLAKDIAK